MVVSIAENRRWFICARDPPYCYLLYHLKLEAALKLRNLSTASDRLKTPDVCYICMRCRCDADGGLMAKEKPLFTSGCQEKLHIYQAM
jgi:hypothetical protein